MITSWTIGAIVGVLVCILVEVSVVPPLKKLELVSLGLSGIGLLEEETALVLK